MESDRLLETELDRLYRELNRAEQVQLLQWVVRDLGDSAPGTENAAPMCAEAATVVRTRIPVWVLEQACRLGMSDAALLRAYPSLRADELARAWAYVRGHGEEVAREIADSAARTRWRVCSPKRASHCQW